jgi:predicted PurR-regulated permease PerM
MNKQIPTSIIRQVFTLLVILMILIISFTELLPYLGGVLGAITLYVLLVGFQRKLEDRGWNASLTASLLMVGACIAILLPIAGIGIMFASKLKSALNNQSSVEESIKQQLAKIQEFIGYDLSGVLDTGKIGEFASSSLQGLASSSASMFIAVGLMLFLLYYMLVHRSVWQKAALDYLPLKEENIKNIGEKGLGLVRSNAVGIPMVAILQGIIALIGYYIFGVDNPFFWFVITTIGSMIPFVGTALGILPVFLILLSQGETGSAIGILIYGITVVGATDNIFRLVVQRKLADIHPLITLIGVLVGVPLFGFIGLVFGPLLISSVLLLIKIYKDEYVRKPENI